MVKQILLYTGPNRPKPQYDVTVTATARDHAVIGGFTVGNSRPFASMHACMAYLRNREFEINTDFPMSHGCQPKLLVNAARAATRAPQFSVGILCEITTQRSADQNRPKGAQRA